MGSTLWVDRMLQLVDHWQRWRMGPLRGSATNLYDCMRKAVEMGIPKEQAIRAATINPAVSIGVRDEVGSLEAGKYANIVIADKELRRRQVILKGVIL